MLEIAIVQYSDFPFHYTQSQFVKIIEVTTNRFSCDMNNEYLKLTSRVVVKVTIMIITHLITYCTCLHE